MNHDHTLEFGWINHLMQKDVVGSSVNPTLELRMQEVGFTGSS